MVGNWSAVYKRGGRKATYIITQTNDGRVRIHVKSCNWKSCNEQSDLSASLSKDAKYSSTKGWFEATQGSESKLMLRRSGNDMQFIYTDFLTKQDYNGYATRLFGMLNLLTKKNTIRKFPIFI